MKHIDIFILSLISLLAIFPAQAKAPDLLLLNKYQPGMSLDGWLMSEKLDGVRAYWNGKNLVSRQGNVFFAPEWFTEKLPPFDLDGELWLGYGKFSGTVSIVSRDQPQDDWHKITYHVFEVPDSPGSLKQRLGRLQYYLLRQPLPHVQIIPQIAIKSNAHMMDYFAQVEARGGEGLVLRYANSLYETGRSHNALKFKHFSDMEGKVIGYRAGKGKYTGKVGALWVEIASGIRFYIGSGLTDKLRLLPPAIGEVVTFKYQGYTSKGIPRFASFLRVRKTL